MIMHTSMGYEKNGTPGAKDKNWPGDYLDVDDRVLIPWLKTYRKMDTESSWNGDWKYGGKAYI
jgi:hypothetical protein